MSARPASRWAPLLAAALLASGCRTPLPAVAPLPSDDPRPAALLEALLRKSSEVRAVRGTARVSIEGRRGGSFAKQVVLIERPARLRVEVIGLLNQRVAVLATDGEQYQLYRAENGAVESGAVRPSVLLEVAGLPLPPGEAVSLLLGGPRPDPDGWRPGPAAALADGGMRVELAGPAREVRRSFEFDAESNLRRYQIHAPDGELLLEVRYEDLRRVSERAFPHSVGLDFPAIGTKAHVSWRSVELNPELPASLFRLELPST